MYYVVDTNRDFDEVSQMLVSEAPNYGFGVLHIHDMGKTFSNKGIEFDELCRIFEVCNPIKASEVMSIEMQLNMALPCRISVFTQNGTTKIGLIKPTELLSALSDNPKLKEISTEVEKKLIELINNIK